MKQVTVGNGITIYVDDHTYIKIGRGGKDVMVRCNGKVYGFDSFDKFALAIDKTKVDYFVQDK